MKQCYHGPGDLSWATNLAMLVQSSPCCGSTDKSLFIGRAPQSSLCFLPLAPFGIAISKSGKDGPHWAVTKYQCSTTSPIIGYISGSTKQMHGPDLCEMLYLSKTRTPSSYPSSIFAATNAHSHDGKIFLYGAAISMSGLRAWPRMSSIG